MTDHAHSESPATPSSGAFEADARSALEPRSPDSFEPQALAPRATSHPQGSEAAAPAVEAGSTTGQRRRRRRGGRRRRRNREDGAAPAQASVEGAEVELTPAGSVETTASSDASAQARSGDASSLAARPRRRRRRGRGRGGRGEVPPQHAGALDSAHVRDVDDAVAPAATGEAVAEPQAESIELAPSGAAAEGNRSRRRGRRGRGRGRRREGETPFERPELEAGAGDAGLAPLEAALDGGPAALAAPGVAPRPESADGLGSRRRRRRGGRGRRRREPEVHGPAQVELIPGEDDELPLADSGAGDEADADLEPSALRDDAQQPAAARPRRSNVILVNAADREEVRVAVVEGGQMVDFQMHVRRQETYVNDIYRGKVVNLEPAIGAAFVDFGQGRNGFLHTSDVLSVYGDDDWSLDKLLTTKVDPSEWDEESSQPDVAVELTEGEAGPAEEGRDAEPAERRGQGRRDRRRHGGRGGGRFRARPRLPISDLLEKGESVVVQVTKDAIGDKGPTLTTYISIPGRYLVLMPSMARTGVSRKIEDEKERRRLKRILEELDVPKGMGVIVRTAGTGCTRADLKRDLDYLMLLWEDFGKRLQLGRGPTALYEESDVAIRTIRDLFTDATEAVIVDDARVYERVREFVQRLMPDNLDRIQLHEGPKPLFHTHNVEQDFERIFARRIDLPSGGSIVFDQAEALVAIDVNSGKTRSESFDFEEVALRTNLDAVKEIARQIRLRDLGGIIVIDFIDMQRHGSRKQVERALRDAMAVDRARSKLGRISQFGLLELTRQRLGPGLSKLLFHNCPRCRGTGRSRTVESRAGAILRRIGAALSQKGFTKVEVRAAPEVIEYLKRNYPLALHDLEVKNERQIELIPVEGQVEDSVLRYLRADGREVRPGGRRKR
jgi:ribonuclease E